MLLVTAVNLSNLAEVSDYSCRAFINECQIAQFTVKNHVRSAGAPALLRLMASAWEAENKLPNFAGLFPPKEAKRGRPKTVRSKLGYKRKR
jgi:hypothetical protein